MTTKHTPGPWRINPGAVEVRGADWNDIVADVGSDADARLIAAAPDLLAALEDMLGHCRFCDGKGRCYGHVPGNPGRHAPDQPCPDCGDARAAIAKAKGENP